MKTAEPEVPQYPHLPAKDAHAIAEFDRKKGTAELPFDPDGHVHIPEDAEHWIGDFMHSKLGNDRC